jgi:hypothetical protein
LVPRQFSFYLREHRTFARRAFGSGSDGFLPGR